jgi:hypothetical protein
MTTTKWLMAIQAKVNKIIDIGNEWEVNANNYTDEAVAVIQKEYDDLMILIKNGDIIADNSIDMSKLKPTFLTDLQDIIIKSVHDATKFVAFGLDKNGYFYADIPETWDEINFSTDSDGNLCLEVES